MQYIVYFTLLPYDILKNSLINKHIIRKFSISIKIHLNFYETEKNVSSLLTNMQVFFKNPK